MTADEYTRRTGTPPVQDDLDRVNCDRDGLLGHNQCGWCAEHDAPRFRCGCMVRDKNRPTSPK